MIQISESITLQNLRSLYNSLYGTKYDAFEFTWYTCTGDNCVTKRLCRYHLNCINRILVSNSGHAAFVRITVGTEENDVSSHRICHVVRGEGAVATNHVTCDAPVVGRFVRLQRFNSRGAWMINELTICEVQVYGYLYHGMEKWEADAQFYSYSFYVGFTPYLQYPNDPGSLNCRKGASQNNVYEWPVTHFPN